MKNIKLTAFFAGITALFGSCHIYNYVTVNKDPDADFAKYKSFAWLGDISDTLSFPYESSIVRNNIKNYFGKELSKRGFRFDPDYPQVLLQLVIVNVPKTREIVVPSEHSRYYTESDFYFPYRNDYYYSGRKIYCYPQGYCVEQVQYIQGSITLNIIDREKNKEVWTATALGDIYDPAFIHQSIHPAVKRIMSKYPVKPGRLK